MLETCFVFAPLCGHPYRLHSFPTRRSSDLTIMASKNALRTEELAVMFDTQHTLELTEQAVALDDEKYPQRSEEHTSELQSLRHLVCRLLLEKKKKDIPLILHLVMR